MKNFDNPDGKIGSIEIIIAIPSLIVGVGILFLPNFLAIETIAADGWISIIAGGIIAAFIAWCIAKIASSFPGQSFMDYATVIVTKPVAIVLTFVFSLIALNIASYQIRSISNITTKYLLSETPTEIISLVFFLVVIYAVAGSRDGIFRLNMLFFPIIILITMVVLIFSVGHMQVGHLQPMFQTDFNSYIRGINTGVISYLGFGVLWFYTQYMRNPKEAPKAAVIGVSISVILYVIIFIVTIGVFGNSVTTNLLYPTIELAKSVEIPGEFFERFESVFFVIWIMAIFNTTAMIVDIMVLTLMSVFTKFSKLMILYITSPLLFFIAMIPRNVVDIDIYGSVIGNTAFSYTIFVVIVLFLVSKIRGRNK